VLSTCSLQTSARRRELASIQTHHGVVAFRIVAHKPSE